MNDDEDISIVYQSINDDQEEGEISDFSEISDGEIQSIKPEVSRFSENVANQDHSISSEINVLSKKGRYGDKFKRQDDSKDGSSPQIIYEDLSKDSNDYDDLNEDELYLRLMALRTMAPEVDTVIEEPISEQKHVNDMEELIDEADQAAQERDIQTEDNSNSSIPSGDDKSKYLSNLMKKVRKNLARQNKNDELSQVISPHSPTKFLTEFNGDEHYSPTQSPILISSSPTSTIYSPGSPKTPSVIEALSKENSILEVDVSNHEHVDMDLGSENEAENMFFKEQSLSFPSSIWDFVVSKKESDKIESTLDETSVLIVNSDVNSAPITNGKISEDKKQSSAAKENLICTENNVSEDDEDELREMLLSSLNRKKQMVKTKNKSNNASAESSPKTITNKTNNSSPKTTAKNQTKKVGSVNGLHPSSKVIKKQVNKVQLKKSKLKKSLTFNHASLKSMTVCPKDLQSYEFMLKTDISRLDPKVIEKRIYNVIMKHFPNILKPFIIPLVQNKPKPRLPQKNSSTTSINGFTNFEAQLDLLMKEGRKDAIKKKTPPPKPVRKSILNKKNTIKTHLSPKDKEALFNSSVKHLPAQKQLEYKQLKDKLEKLKKAKVLKASKVPIGAKKKLFDNPSNDANYSSDTLKTPTPINSDNNSTSTPIVKPSAPKVVDVPKATSEDLKNGEKNVIDERKKLVDTLFKMSAELSSLKDEQNRQTEALNLVSDLKRQLAEAESALAKKDNRVNQLRQVVSNSHKQLRIQNNVLKNAEKNALTLGKEFIGDWYNLPQDLSQTIKKKLSSVSNKTQEIINKETPNGVATTNNTIKENKIENKTKNSIASPSSDISNNQQTEKDECSNNISDKSVPGIKDYSNISTSLAHLRPSKNAIVLDSNKELCRFELNGKCNDDSCSYQHILS